MAYNTKKGSQHSGDIQYEGDPDDTQIDFENDLVALKTNGTQRFIVSGPTITGSAAEMLLKVSAETTGSFLLKFEGDSESYVRVDSDGVDLYLNEYNSGKTRVGSATAPDHTLSITGDLSASSNISASAFYGDGSTLSGLSTGTMSSFSLAGDAGSSQAITDGNTLTVAGGTGLTSTAGATDTVTIALDNTAVSAGSYTYSAITVDAQGRLTAASSGTPPQLPAIQTYSNAADNRVITSVDSTSVQGEAGLTYNGSILAATGEISASLGVTGSSLRTATTIIDATHISSSLNISGSKFYGDGSNLTNTIHVLALSGDSGTQVIENGDTIKVAGGTGLTSLAAATDTVTISLDNTAVSAGSYTYSAITVDAQGRLTAASSGTGPAITTYSGGATSDRIITSDGATSVNAETGLTYNGSILAATGEVSASLGVTGSSLRTATTVIDATHISSSLNISGSKFYGDGSTLSGVGGGTMSSWTLSADGGSNQAITDGNTVDIAGGTGITTAASATDTVTVNLDDTSVSAGSYTYSAITVDAQGRLTAASSGTGPAITTYSNASDNRIITCVNNTSVQGEAGLTYDGSILAATGQISASLGVSGSSLRTATTVIDATHISSSLNVSGAAFYGDGSNLSNLPSSGISWDGSTANGVATYKDSDEATVEANLTFDGNTLTTTNASNTAIPAIKIDRDYTGTTSIGNLTTDPQGLLVDYDVTGIVASGQTAFHDAIAINFNQDSPTMVGTVNSTGLDCRMTGGASGTQTMKGVAVRLAGAGTNIGLDVEVPDGQDHVMLRSSADTGDYFAISTTTHGATTIKTHDDDATAAHLTCSVDGNIVLDPAGSNVIVDGNLSASINISASAFYGDGSNLTNLPSSGISWDGSTANGVATYKDSDEATVESNLTFDGTDLGVSDKIVHIGDTDTFINFTDDDINFQAGGVNFMDLTEDTQNEVTFNEGGVDVDFRIETADESHMLFVEGSSNRMSIGDNTGSPGATLEIKNHASAGASGVPLLQLNNNDTDQQCLDINAGNIDANVVNITANDVTTARVLAIGADGLTTGNALYVDDNSSNTGTRNTALIIQNDAAAINAQALAIQSDGGKTGVKIDKNYSDLTEASVVGLDIDWDKTGASTSDNTMYGIQLDMDNTTATNGINTMYGIHCTPRLTHAADAGECHLWGINIESTAGTNGTSINTAGRLKATGGDINYGLFVDCGDGASDVDFRIRSQADNADYFQIKTIANGATTISTVDGGASAAHLTCSVDGDIVLEPVGKHLHLSGNMTIKGNPTTVDGPTIHFSSSLNDAMSGHIGLNSSNNILIQNNSLNKHIVFKANDNGTIREGIRLNGAVPEVVVNESPESMINFRVESALNQHMLYVSGGTNQVGIGVSDPAPEVTLDISGSAIRLRNSSTPSAHNDFGVKGEIRWDTNYLYICVATDTWKRVALAGGPW